MKIVNRIDIIFIISAIVTFLLGGITLLNYGPLAIDIQLHDTSFIIAFKHFIAGFLVCLVLSALLYSIVNWAGIKTILVLNWLHFLLTFQLLIVVLYFYPVEWEANRPRVFYLVSSLDEARSYQPNLRYIAYSFLGFILGQLCLLINFVISFSAHFVKNFKNKK